MTIREGTPVRRRRRLAGGAATLGAVAVLSIVTLAFTSGALAAEAPVNLGTTASYAVLAGTTVTNTGPTTVNGNLGLSPGSSVTGFPPGLVSGGVQNVANAEAVQAQSDLVTAYNDAAGRTPATTVLGDGLGGLTLVAGLYSGGALDLTGTLTLDAQGDSGAVFIFQAASTLITASASQVRLVNGASPCNVFWKVGSSATLGTTTSFKGTILALTSIALNTGATVDGRLLARNGAVTLDSNTINSLDCSGSTAPPDEVARRPARDHRLGRLDQPRRPETEHPPQQRGAVPRRGQPAARVRRAGVLRYAGRQLPGEGLDLGRRRGAAARRRRGAETGAGLLS